MDLLILRHGLAEERSDPATGGDSQRRLTKEGRQKMRRIARGMQSLEVKPDLILTSPYLRARETSEIVAKALGSEKRLQMAPTLQPDGNPKELIDSLKNNFRKRQQVLLVGHEPYLSRLISLLVSGDTRIAIMLKKGGLCLLSTESLQYGRCATLEWLLTPAQLRSVH